MPDVRSLAAIPFIVVATQAVVVYLTATYIIEKIVGD